MALCRKNLKGLLSLISIDNKDMLFNNFQVRTVSRFVYGALETHDVSFKTFLPGKT